MYIVDINTVDIGDRVICINGKSSNLTNGKVYVIEKMFSSSSMVRVINDFGYLERFYITRFKIDIQYNRDLVIDDILG